MAKKTIEASLVGIQYQIPPFNVYTAISKELIGLRRDKKNQHDKNAVEVTLLGHTIGFLNKESAMIISRLIDVGHPYKINVNNFAIGAKSIGLSIEFQISDGILAKKPALENVAGIYLISINDKEFVYIGQSIKISERISSHWNDLEFNSHTNKNLQHLWNTRGSNFFSATVLEIAPNDLNSDLKRQRWLAEREIYWIKISREKYSCVNITDGELIATKNAVKEYEAEKKAENKKFDSEIKENKRLLNLQLEKTTEELVFHKNRLSEYRAKVSELDSFVRKNTGIRGYFSGTASQAEIKRRSILLDKAIVELRDQESLVSKIYKQSLDLKKQHRGLKTTRQLEALKNSVLLRHGVNPQKGKKKIE